MSYYRDDKSFRSYRVDREYTDWNQEELSTLLEKKEKMVLKAVVQNNVGLLTRLFSSQKLYKITDKHGLNLLHIAILQNSKEVFDYLLLISDFPLEMVSDYGETALITAILVIDIDGEGQMKAGSDYFALELIRRGADIFYCDNFGYTTLSCAALKHHVAMANFFVAKGVDIDKQDIYGNTALHNATDHVGPNALEFVSLLLYHGANPRVKNKDDLVPFEKAVLHCNNPLIQDILFYYTYDDYFKLKTNLSVLLKLARYESPLLIQLEEVITDDFSRGNYIQLFYIDVEYLKILIKQFKTVMGSVLSMCTLDEWSRNAVNFEKLEVFIDSELKDKMICCIQNIEDELLFRHLIECEFDESTLSEIVCYLLSYGLNVTEGGLQKIYEKFGYCELFMILLQMDIKMVCNELKQIMPTLLYDVKTNLLNYLENPYHYSSKNVDLLLRYFVNPKLNVICFKLYGDECVAKIRSLPNVPSLIESSRNVFRQYFIDRYKIENSKQFYTYIKNLDISDTYKKIIMYEKTLY